MTTLQEKQAELDSLQTAFDEYIASSRELEEELEAELTKSQNDLSKATARNIALASQLSDISPQLTSLETELSNTSAALRLETQRRISAETAAEEAENSSRRAEAATISSRGNDEAKKLREECEDLYERLAIAEGELEEREREYEEERERWRMEMGEVRDELTVVKERSEAKGSMERRGDGEQQLEQEVVVAANTAQHSEEYIKTLEEELELVTEQLIESETNLSRTQAELEEALAHVSEARKAIDAPSQSVVEWEDVVKVLEENAALKNEMKRVKEEFELVTQELAFSKEELAAAEEDGRAASADFDIERKQLKGQITGLRYQLDNIASEDRSRDIQSKSWEEALISTERENQLLQEKLVRVELALQNSKADCESLLNEMDELKSAFDEKKNQDTLEVIQELLSTRTREVEELREEVKSLKDTDSSLVNPTSAEFQSGQLQEAQFEIQSLEGLLEDARKELTDRRQEVDGVRSSLQDKISHVEEELATAVEELEITRSKLFEAQERSRLGRSSTLPFDSFPRPKHEPKLSFSDATLTKFQMDETSKKESDYFRSHALSRRIFSHKSRSRPRSCSPTNVQRLERDAEQRATQTSTLRNTCDRLEDQNRMSVGMKNRLDKEIQQLQKQLLAAKITHNNYISIDDREPMSDVIIMSTDDRDIEEVIKSNNTDMIAEELRLLAKKVSAQKTHNAELLTRILKLQGNIQVCCRLRPITAEECQKGYREVTQALSETELGCFDERTRMWKSYAFDKVWGPDTRQRDVFQDVEPMALSVVDGYNACIFAYGQTGSGKTYTMEGDKKTKQFGISQRTIHKIFSILKDRALQHQNRAIPLDGEPNPLPRFEYSIEVGMLEIYNDEVYDLLAPSLTRDNHGTLQRKPLDIRHGAENTVEVPGLTKESATSVSEVLAALDRGNSNRATASTNLNERSSRSHMILQVEVISGVGEAKQKASLYLVDLAGSERVRKSEVEGKALKEAQHINKSLSALGNVMEALDQRSSHVPYRDSKLTYLLQNSLGGNSRTMMVVTICPHNYSYDESVFALKFAIRVRRINLGTAQRNVTAKNLEETVKNLNSQMSLLSKAKERSEGQILSLKREKDRIEDKLAKSSTSRANSKEEMRTLSVLRQSNHDITSRWQKEKLIREEKTAELEKTQEELRRLQRELTSVKRDQESFERLINDKENIIFDLKKDLRNMKDQLNEGKIRQRRTNVMQSRIPGPSASVSTKFSPSNKSTTPLTSAYLKTNGNTILMKSALTASPNSGDPTIVRIRTRVFKLLQDHDPNKVDRIDTLMKQYEGRETELIEKMMVKYGNANEKDSGESPTISENGFNPSGLSLSDERTLSRQQKAVELHKARMNNFRRARADQKK